MATPAPLPPDTPLDILQLSFKAYGFLRRSQIHTLGDLLDYTQEDLHILDPETALEILAALEQHCHLTLPAS